LTQRPESSQSLVRFQGAAVTYEAQIGLSASGRERGQRSCNIGIDWREVMTART